MKRQKITLVMINTVIMLGLLLAPAIAQNNTAKIGYANLSQIFDGYYKTKNYDEVLASKHQGFEKERNALIEEINQSESKLSLLTDDKKAALSEEIEKKKASLLEFDRQKKTDLTKERNEKVREILLEIEKIVSDFAKKENYSMIIMERVLIYGDPADDLTEKILTILNADQPK